MKKHLLSSSFASAVLGGLVSLSLGIAAVGSGLVELEDEAAVAVPAAEAAVSAGGSSTPVSSDDGASLSVNEIYAKDAPGVVYIESQTRTEAQGFFGGGAQVASGSGFVIDEEGHILTNAHVVDGAEEVRVTLTEDGDPVSARVIGTDPSTDVAVLDVDASEGEVQPLELGSSEDVEVGDPVVAIGNPFALSRTVTAGIVSAIQRQIPALNGFTITDAIQTDAPINPGSSGGPLLDSSGRVIGIASQIETGGGSGNVGIGFAVPIDTARVVADQLIAGGEAEHAFLGVSAGDLLPSSDVDGALVRSVTADGPADEGGIEPRDVITEFGGEPIGDAADLIAAVNGHAPGDEVDVTILRDGTEQILSVILADRPANAA